MSRLIRGFRVPGRRRWRRVVAAASVTLAFTTVAIVAQQRPDFRDSPFLRIDPERIVMSPRDSRTPCGECHVSEYEVWSSTKHATGFETMHRTESAHDILEKLGLTVTKRQESLCMRCHYTVGPELRAIAGVSCESCHGPARDWKDVHNTWGEGVENRDDETAEHRRQRIEQSAAAGMLRPSGNLYGVAANCFECHTVPVEDLVNRGGHKSGSSRFDLTDRVAEIRHNFLQEQWGGAPGNREPAAGRTRLMFVVGRLLSYEFSLRGMAVATTEGRYSKSMERRIVQSYRDLEAVARAADLDPIRDILAVGADLRIVPGNETGLLAAADRIRSIGRMFAETVDTAQLVSLDPLMAGSAVVAGQPDDDASTADSSGTGGRAGGAPSDSGGSASRDSSGGAGGTTTSTSTDSPAVPDLPGRIRNRPAWFPAIDGRYRTTVPGCDCHSDAEDWWFDNAHEGSAAPLINKDPKAREIATLYGIGPDQMTRGDRICMNCHGTALSDAPAAEVFTGVSCERCHGPSSEYLDPHEDGGNPQLGMIALKQADVRAAVCLNCHRITDERLLAAGHTSGADYDIVSATKDIVHWPDKRPDRARQKRGEGPYAGPADAALEATAGREIAARPVPQVTVVKLPNSAATAAGTGGRRQPGAAAGQVRARGAPASSSQPPRPSSTRSRLRSGANGAIEIEPFPEMADTLTSEEILLLVRKRLERLIAQLGRGG